MLGPVGPTHGGRMTETANAGPNGVKRRGFASMDPAKQREIASKGGVAAHEKGTAHEWTRDEAAAAGRKGGQLSRGGRGRLDVPGGTRPGQKVTPPHPSTVIS